MHFYFFTQRLRLSYSNFSSGFDPPWLRVKRIIHYNMSKIATTTIPYPYTHDCHYLFPFHINVTG